MKYQIVLVDDEEINNALLEEVLLQYLDLNSYEIRKFSDPPVALEYCLESERVDLILLDLFMPEVSGEVFIKKYKKSCEEQQKEEASIIVISANEDSKTISDIINLGVEDYFTKPFTGEIVGARVNSCLIRKRLERGQKDDFKFRKILLRTVIHDVSNPIQILHFLLEQVDDEYVKEHMQRAVDTLSEIIEEVKLLEAYSSDKRALKKEEIHPDDFYAYFSEYFADTMKAKNLKLKYKCSLGSEKTLSSDCGALKNQILGNIISNAIKFSVDNGEIEISVSEESDSYLISVLDQGIGIPKELQAGLFDWFTKTSRPGTKGEVGTGFGLPIVKHFSDMLGHKITVISPCYDVNGKTFGSRFDLRIQK